LSNYDDDDLVDFAEDIEGRIEVLFTREYLLGLADYFQITPDIIRDFQSLKSFLVSLYGSGWSGKMKDKTVWKNANVIGHQILRSLNLSLVEPKKFAENHLDIDWT